MFREKIFSRTHKREEEEISEGGHTVSRVISLNVLTRSCHATERRAQRETHRQRDDRDLTLETSDRGGRFSLSFCVKVRASE